MERRVISSCGVPIYSYLNTAQHTFHISLYLRLGSMFEDISGITHFFEHVAIRNINYAMGGELYSMLDKYGLEFNASTSFEMVQFYITGASEHADVGASLITEVLRELVLPTSEINRERERIRAEIREVDEPSTLAGFTQTKIFSGTKLERPITGTLGTTARIGIRALEAFRRSALVAENIFVYVTGNVGDGVIDKISEGIDRFPIVHGEKNDNLAPVSAEFGKRGAAVFVKSAPFTKLRFNFDVDMSEISMPELDLLYDQLLGGYGSDFFIEMSEKRGLFYDVSGNVERYKNIGVFYFAFELREARVTEAVEVALEILRRFKETPIAAEKFIRSSYVDNAMMLYDDYRELNFTFAYDNHIMDSGYESIEVRRSAYESVTPERLMELARMIFTPENLTLTVKGRKNKIDTEALREIAMRTLG